MALYDISGKMFDNICSSVEHLVSSLKACKCVRDDIEQGRFFTDDYLEAIKKDCLFQPDKYYNFKFLDKQISLYYGATLHDRSRKYRVTTFNFQPKCCPAEIFDYEKRCYYGSFDTFDEGIELFVMCVKELVDSFICDNGLLEIFN